MKWVTRERPKIDRIACPWLIERFIEKQPEFLYVPPDKALKVISKFGQPLPPDLIAVPRDHPEYKGVQEELMGPEPPS